VWSSFLAASSQYSGRDWLFALTTLSCGLRLDHDEAGMLDLGLKVKSFGTGFGHEAIGLGLGIAARGLWLDLRGSHQRL